MRLSSGTVMARTFREKTSNLRRPTEGALEGAVVATAPFDLKTPGP